MRLFIAIEISDEIKTELVKMADRLKETKAEVKWVRPEGMHLTLRFLGEVEEGRKKIIEDILDKFSTTKPFTITLQGLGAFPNLNSPRVIWVGIERGREELKKISFQLEELLEKRGFPREGRGFEPHLTLGRVRPGHHKVVLAKKLSAAGQLALANLKVDRMILMESILKREGPEYRRVKDVRLGCHCERSEAISKKGE